MEAKSLLGKKIPTIVGMVVLAAGLIVGVVLVGRAQFLSVRAGPTAVPRNVKVVSLGATSLTVTWTTDTPVIGSVKYSDNPAKLSLPAGDRRDQRTGTAEVFTTHFVEIVGLTTGKTYYFEVVSGSKVYDDKGKPYQTRTVKQANPPSEDLISGKVLSSSGQGAGGVIVYVDMEGAETLAALTNDDGSWRLPLSMARNKQGQFVQYDAEKTALTIFAQGGSGGTATALTNTKIDSPVPEITLGKTHNFVEGDFLAGGDSGQEQTGDKGSGFTDLTNASGSGEIEKGLAEAAEATLSVKLSNPEFNGEKIATTSPEIRGKAPAGTILKITINSETEQMATITVDPSGEWSFTPPAGLEPGEHTMTIEYTDEGGVLQRIARHFTVLAADGPGGTPAFTATPSATPTPTATPSATPTPTATPSSGSARTSMPATDSGLLDVGVLTPTYVLLIVGLGLFISGLIWRNRLGDLITDE